MKNLFLLPLAIISLQAMAFEAPVLKGNMNLDSVVTDYARSKGINGMLPIKFEASADSAKIMFNGFNKSVVCVSYGPEEIPSHPETAPCLKYETHWLPSAKVSVTGFKSELTVGDVKIDGGLSKEFSLAWNCISNIKDETIVSEVRPTSLPSKLVIKAGCYAFSYNRVEDRMVKPKALKGESMEAVVDITVKLPVAQDFVLVGDEVLDFDLSLMKTENGTMGDFGGYRTRIFKYYDRVLLQ
ncbi:MAG: hypothetical protein K2P81_03160 [Bacteriovoracaceae bacterium]|nr:hypothetical protein [Bacteriovoracaceae bacterium]